MKCKIWNTYCDNETPTGLDGWRINSARAGGKYEISGTLISTETFKNLTCTQKVLITDHISEKNAIGKIPSLNTGSLPEILSRPAKTLTERKSAFLKTIFGRNRSFGKKVKCFGEGPSLVAVNMDNYSNPAVKTFLDSHNDFLAKTSCTDVSERQALASSLVQDGMITSNGPKHSIFALTGTGYEFCENLIAGEIEEKMVSKDKTYDVALSFAGEDREYVERVAQLLAARNVGVFYDKYEKAELWGKDLYTHLSKVYKDQARYTLMFLSKYYRQKLWTNHERQAAQARAFKDQQEYILPARFDDTEIPGVLETTGYIDLRITTPEELVELIMSKLDE